MMARVRIRSIYDVYARDEQPPVVVETSYGPVVVLVGSEREFDIDTLRGIRLADKGETFGDANEATKPVSDTRVLREQAQVRDEGSVTETEPLKPVNEQSDNLANTQTETRPIDNPSGTQPNITERQPEVRAGGTGGMQNSLGADKLPPESGGAGLQPQGSTGTIKDDPLSLLRK